MAYQGRKVFQAGEVLTASDLNSTVDQTVMVFADTTARDTAIPTPSEGMIVYLESDNSVLKYDGSQWTNIQLDIDLTANRVVVSDGSGDLAVSGVTTTELDKLDGLTATTTELNYVDGVTSPIQTQLNAKQPLTPSVNAKSANYTLAIGDRGEFITVDGSRTITVPNGVFSAGDRVDIVNIGTGTVTFSAGAGLTLNSENSKVTIDAQYKAATVFYGSSSVAYLIGGLA